MSNNMEDVLMSWNLEELIPIFNQNEITLENLSMLSEDLIKELIPSIGKRMKFLTHWKDLKGNDNETSVPPEAPHENLNETNDSVSDSVEVESEANTSRSTISPIEIIFSEENSICKEKDIVANSPLYVVPIVNRMTSFCGEENIKKSLGLDFPDFDLKTLLNVSPYGDLILNYYNLHGILNEYMRNKLMDIIVKHLYVYIMKHRLNHQQYNIVCSKIIALFPSECVTKYYKAGQRINNLAVQARGKLVDKVRNLLYKSPDKVYVRRRKSRNKDESSNPARDTTEEENKAITWLTFNREPWSEVIRLWKMTHDYRLASKTKTLSQFTNCWPSIEDPRADSLIEADFDTLYPGKELLLLTNWNRFFEKIESIKKPEITNKDPVLQDILLKLSSNSGENISEDGKVALQLISLGRLIPPKGRIKSGKNHWKFSVSETVESIIIHCLNPGDVEKVIQDQKEKALKRKISYGEVQPYLIVVGPNICDGISTTYLIIEKIQYQFSSVLKAFDVLFKCFIALDLKYPPPAEHIYALIQKGIFGIYCETDKPLPYIDDVLKHLEF